MVDSRERQINYMRLSVTDRCNLRCRYCMPAGGVEPVEHGELLRYEELLRLAALAVELGITRFKITGGEPLVRRGCVDLITELKRLPGVEQVTLTTNGILLPTCLEQLAAAGIDGVNISLDTLDPAQYQTITRSSCHVEDVVAAAEACSKRLPTKLNAVLLPETADQIIPLAELAERLELDVRFIETMPMDGGLRETESPPVLERLKERWPDLAPTAERRGNGPARYWGSPALRGRIGLIQALSHAFCESCNRVRLTSTGTLLPCLFYDRGADLRALLRSGAADGEVRRVMEDIIFRKPAGHRFADGTPGCGRMYQIGG